MQRVGACDLPQLRLQVTIDGQEPSQGWSGQSRALHTALVIAQRCTSVGCVQDTKTQAWATMHRDVHAVECQSYHCWLTGPSAMPS